MRIVWTWPATQDLEHQIRHIAKENPSAAREQLRRIRSQYPALARHPELGHPGRVPETRELVISRTPFLLVYRITAAQIEILRMLHGAQQWPSDDS
jgi:toxin ParE1/3/4